VVRKKWQHSVKTLYQKIFPPNAIDDCFMNLKKSKFKEPETLIELFDSCMVVEG